MFPLPRLLFRLVYRFRRRKVDWFGTPARIFANGNVNAFAAAAANGQSAFVPHDIAIAEAYTSGATETHTFSDWIALRLPRIPITRKASTQPRHHFMNEVQQGTTQTPAASAAVDTAPTRFGSSRDRIPSGRGGQRSPLI